MSAGITAAAQLRPRPSVIVVLTDGYTPWPQHPPKGTQVVIGALPKPSTPTTRGRHHRGHALSQSPRMASQSRLTSPRPGQSPKGAGIAIRPTPSKAAT